LFVVGIGSSGVLIMKVVFLGTNGWYSTGLANTSCVLIDTEKYYVVLDAGDGIYKLEEYIKIDKPIILFLSHLHLDHIIGLHIFGKFRFNQSISIYGYAGTEAGLRIIRHPYTAPFNELPLKIEIHDLKEGKYSQPFPFTCKLLVHSDQCLGYRLELDNRVVAYCTDTGICRSMNELSENASLLIAECSFKSGEVENIWRHLRPEDAANIAVEADVGRLVLTHFDAGVYKSKDDRKYAEAIAKKIFKNTIAAFDGLEIEI
jgi:ribonuclease BN (tRNA processing enzyme)